MRRKTIITRTKFEFEYEKDKQLHLRSINHEAYNAEILKRLTDRLATLQINQQIRRDAKWIDEVLLPRIHASGRQALRPNQNQGHN